MLGFDPRRLGDNLAQIVPAIWSEWRLTVIAATVRIALVDFLDLSEVDIPAGVFLHPAVAGAEDGEGIRPTAGTGNE